MLCVLNGARHKRKVGSKEQARDYYAWCQQQNRARQRGDWQEPEPQVEIPTVAIEDFMSVRRTRGSESSLPGYQSNARLFTEMFGPLRADQLTTRMVEAFVEGRLEAGLKPGTVNRQIGWDEVNLTR